MNFKNVQFLEEWECGAICNLFPSSLAEVVALIYTASEKLILKLQKYTTNTCKSCWNEEVLVSVKAESDCI